MKTINETTRNIIISYVAESERTELRRINRGFE
jgi:hypothetical protein